MAKRRPQTFIKGSDTHCRTEGNYISALLETVTLADWQEVVGSALADAKQGDAQARAWLAQYQVGKPAGRAPKPLTVVAQQLNCDNPLINRLANPVIDQYKYPELHQNDAWKTQIKALVAAELVEKTPLLETASKLLIARLAADLDDCQLSLFD